MMTELELRRDDLSKKMMHLSLQRLKHVNNHVTKMNRPKLTYMFMSLDQIFEYEDKLRAKFDREDAVFQEREDKLELEMESIERQLAEQVCNV